MQATSVGRVGVAVESILSALTKTDDRPLIDMVEIKALFLQHGANSLCLFSADLGGLNRADAFQLRETTAKSLGIPLSAVHIATTHTHAAGGLGNYKIDILSEIAAKAAKQARDQACAVNTVGFLDVDTQGHFNINRRTRTGNLGVWCLMQSAGCHDDGKVVDGTEWVRKKMLQAGAREDDLHLIKGPFLADRPADTTLSCLLFKDGEGTSVAAVVRFTAHAVICSGGYWKPNISRDYPGALCDRLTAAWGCPVLFLQGPAADHRPRHVDVGPEECKRIGHGLADTLLQAQSSMQFFPFDKLHAEQAELPADIRSEVPVTREEADESWQAARKKLAETEHGSLEALWERRKNADIEKFWSTVVKSPGFLNYLTPAERRNRQAFLPLSLLQIGPVSLLQFPGEISGSLLMDLAGSHPSPLIVTSYTDGNVGYMLSPEDFAEGGYETSSTLLAPTTAGRLKDLGRKLLRKIAP